MSKSFQCNIVTCNIVTSGVFSANGIKVYLFDDCRPTPEISYGIRKLGCQSGVVITASHNPKEYNGYKVYGEDGAQMSPEATAKVVEYISQITDSQTGNRL